MESYEPEGQSQRMFDISTAQRDLGFVPSMSLAEGLTRTVECFRELRTGDPVPAAAN